MTLTLSQETEEKIAAQAREHGLSLEQYAKQIFERDEHPTYRLPKVQPTAESLRAGLLKLAEGERPAVEYPEDFFSRDVIYADHD
jgi:hypothetical protein